MDGQKKVIEGILPVTTSKCVYMDGTNQLLSDYLANLALVGGASKLNGKKWTVIGDSRSVPNQYGEIIANRTGAILNNKAVSGGTIGNSVNYPNVYKIGENAVNNCANYNDIITLAGGVNDYQFDHDRLGTADDMGYDVSTLGAYNQMIHDLIVAYPDALIIVLLPVKIGTNETHTGFDRWVDGIKQVAEKYSVPTIDLYRECGFTAEVAEQKALYIPDGLHPSNAGQNRIANIVQAKIESYL